MARKFGGILTVVMNMKDSKQVLTSLLHTVQMGQNGIRAVMEKAVQPGLQQELRSELAEYDKVEKMAYQLAGKKEWELPKVSSCLLTMSSLTSKARLLYGDTDSTIAAMLIQGNTRGRISGLKDLHRAHGLYAQVQELAGKLLNLEEANIRSAQSFL